jgi:molybdopterin synthase catalytic subunit
MPVIRVTQDDFAISSEYEALRACAPQAGAIVVFTGLVRDISGETAVNGLTLQHYPGMTEKLLAEIVEQAHDRWEIEDVRVIHRVGTLHPAEQIVFVGVAAAHRGDAFEACSYIMDYLKVRATIWKKESRPEGEVWLDDRESDQVALRRWNP